MITCTTLGNKNTAMSNTHHDGSMSDLELGDSRHTSSYNWKKDHPEEQVIGDVNARIQIRRRLTREYSLLSSIEPKCVAKAKQR